MADKKTENVWPGLLLALICGGTVYFMTAGLEPFIPKGFNWGVPRPVFPVDALVAGIIAGMLGRLLVGGRQRIVSGLHLAARFFIPVGIVCYGSKLRFDQLVGVPTLVWWQLLVGIFCVFALTVMLGNKWGLSEATSILIAVGSAICGASAIAITTPVIKGKGREMSLALLVITVVGLAGVFVFPLLRALLDLSREAYALLCATGLHQTGFVKAAAVRYPGEGQACMQLALSIKMVRTAMIIPIVFFLAWSRSGVVAGTREGRGIAAWREVPWFMYAFVTMGVIFSLSAVRGADVLMRGMKTISGLTFTIALTSIGFTVDLRQVVPSIARPLLMGFLVWFSLVAVFMLSYFAGVVV